MAASAPAKLRELQDLFTAAAVRYNVLPLDDRFAERGDVTLRPSFFAGRDKITFYPGMIRLPEGSAPKTTSIHHRVDAIVDIPDAVAQGVLIALGGQDAGWSLFLWNGKPRYHYNFFGASRYDVTAAEALKPGRHTVSFELVPDAPKPGAPANVTLFVDGVKAGDCRIDVQIPARCGMESMDVGMDCVSPVCDDYAHLGLFPFTGTIESVTLKIGEGHHPSGMERIELANKMD